MEAPSRRSLLGIALLGLGVVLFAVSAKLALIQFYGTDQPFADQWAAEGMYFLRGPLYYKIDLTQLTSLHGEHRPALTRLWIRGLILANEGQWDCYVELVADLLIYATFLVVVWKWLVSLVRGAGLGLAAIYMAVLFGLPCAYENFLWGFQSQFLFLLLLGMVHVWGAMSEMRMGIRWWLAHLAGVLGLFSIAAGAMSAAALVVLAIMELLRGRRNAWVWSTLLVNLVLFGVGYWMLPETVMASGGDRLARLSQAVRGLGYLLAWPFAGIWWSVLLQAPWMVLLATWWLKRDDKNARGDGIVGAAGLWVACIAFAIAYGRALTADNIGVRYYDVLILGIFINIPALIRIISRQTSWRRVGWGVGACIWLIAITLGFWRSNRPENLSNMFNFQHGLAVEQRGIIKDFLASDDPAKLQEFENSSHRFPHFQTTLDFLRDPKVPALLPPTLTPDGHENRLSRLARRIASNWSTLLGAGVFFAIVGTWLQNKRSSEGTIGRKNGGAG